MSIFAKSPKRKPTRPTTKSEIAKERAEAEAAILKAGKNNWITLPRVAADCGCSMPTLYTRYLEPGLLYTLKLDDNRVVTTSHFVILAMWRWNEDKTAADKRAADKRAAEVQRLEKEASRGR